LDSVQTATCRQAARIQKYLNTNVNCTLNELAKFVARDKNYEFERIDGSCVWPLGKITRDKLDADVYGFVYIEDGQVSFTIGDEKEPGVDQFYDAWEEEIDMARAKWSRCKSQVTRLDGEILKGLIPNFY
jgi:hypothetical protein